MWHPILFAKDIIDLVRNPPGEAVAACEITHENESEITESLDSNPFMKKAIIGDFAMIFERDDFWTICPRSEFFKHYEFTEDSDDDPTTMRTVRTIKSL